MNYNVLATENFEKEARRLYKKYKSLKTEVDKLIDELKANPTKGIHIGNNVYKIRLAIASKGKGKSGGARIMTYVKIMDETVFMFSIYSNGDKDDISQEEINGEIKDII